MKSIHIDAVVRKEFGKRANRRLRRNNQIPCTIFGDGLTTHLAVASSDVRQLIYTPESFIVVLNVEGTERTAVMREVQFHPVREQVLHIDFYRVDPNKPVEIDIPIRIFGNSIGVRQGGTLHISRRKIYVRGMLETLPDELELDVTTMDLNDTIFVGDLEFEGLTLVTPPGAAVCSVKMTRVAKSLDEDLDEDDELLEGEEGEEGEEGAEGGEGAEEKTEE